MISSQQPVKGTLRQRQKNQTYRLILSSARFLFEKQGYKQTTIRKIAIHAGIGLGTFYKHFKQKSDVLGAAFCEDIGGVLDRSIKSMPDQLSLKEELMYLAAGFFSFYASNLKLAHIYIKQVSFINGEGREQNEELDRRFLDYVVTRVEKAKLENRIRQDIDSSLVAFSFLSNYLMTVGFFFIREDKFSVQKANDLLDRLTDLMINGMVHQPD